MVLVEVRPEVMGPFDIKRWLKILGWNSVAVMFLAVVTVLATSL